MSSASLAACTDKIRFLVNTKRVLIRVRHIEQERRHREINRFHVEQALKNGKATLVRSTDKTIIWRGHDVNGRELELMCSLLDEQYQETVVVREAYRVKVGTAYDPSMDDKKLLIEWLVQHPDHELAPDGKGAQKKTVIEKK